MNYGFYLSTASAITGMRRLDTVANNLANSTTVGFKADVLSMSARLPENIENGGMYSDTNAALDALGGGTLFNPTQIDLSQGTLRKTGNPLDVALEGDGFFMLESPQSGAGANNGPAANDKLLARAGAFSRDSKGRLVLATSGVAVLGTNGKPIVIPADAAKVRIDARGNIFNDTDSIGQLAVVMPTDIANLRKEGRDALRLIGGRTKDAPTETLVRQEHLEESTVDSVAALAELVKVSRSIEFSTRLMQTQDQMTGRLIDTFGRFS
jgi:flagellar basal-body rod protein FlgF